MQRGLVESSPDNIRRGRAFYTHQRRWRSRTAKHYARHAEVEPHTRSIIAAMFDSAVRIVVNSPSDPNVNIWPVREYAYRVKATGQTVRLNAETWQWRVLDGTAEGRGLYELWAWRFGVSVEEAHTGIWAWINSAADADENAA